MTMKKLFIFYLACFLFANSSYSQVKILTLQDCLNIAYTRSTTVLKGNNNIALSGAQVLAAYGQFLPDLAAGAGYNFEGGNNFYSSTGPTVVNTTRSAFNYQVVSSLNLFTGFYNYAAWKAAKLNQQAASLTLERAKQQIELDVTQTYLQLILDRELAVLDSENLVISVKREEQLSMLTDVGRKSKTDLYQQEAQTSSDKLLLINAQNRLRSDKITLLQKLRIDSTDKYDFADIQVEDDAAAGKYGNRDVLVAEALHDRVDLRSAALNTQVADYNITKYKSGYLPKISLNAGLYNNGAYFNTLNVNGQNENGGTQAPILNQLGNQTYGLVGINASWYIFDKYYTRSNVTAAKIQADNARIDYQDTLISLVADVKRAHNDYVNAVQQMETVGAGLTAAQKAYDAVNGRYQVGASDFITEANAQLVLLQAAQSKAQASVNMMLQKKVIDYYIGQDIVQ